MKTLTKEPRPKKQAPRQAKPGRRPAPRSLQRTLGNQAMGRMLQRKPASLDPEADTIVRAADRARKAKDDATGMLLHGSQIVYGLIRKYLPGYLGKISGVGYDATVAGVKAEAADKNDPDKATLSVTVGKGFILGIIAITLKVQAGEIEKALKATGVAPTPDQTPTPQATAPAPDSEAAIEKAFAEKGAAALATLKAAQHKQGTRMRGQLGQGNITAGTVFPKWFMELQNELATSGEWKAEEEAGQKVLRDYAVWHFEQKHETELPANLMVFFEYLGRSSQNDADARKGQYLGTSHFGGSLGAPNWCTATSYKAVFDGLGAMGYEPLWGKKDFKENLWNMKGAQGSQGAQKGKYYGPEAYAEPLLPGDMVMFLFQGSQYGGHTATVVEEVGSSFVHVSGNTGDAIGVGLSESKRMKKKPAKLKLSKANDVGTKAKNDAASAHIRSVQFGDEVLVYSIQRFGLPFGALATLAEIDPAAEPDRLKKILAKFHLKESKPKAEKK